MEQNRRSFFRASLVIALGVFITISSTRLRADTGSCGGVTITLPFADVMASPFFCQIAAAYFSGLTNGTSATTYNPSDPVSREQVSAFVTRTLDQSVKRGSRRAALDQFWTTQTENNLALTTVGTFPLLVKSDGADLWVANPISGTVSRVRASDGRLLETWTGATAAGGVLAAMGKIFITGGNDPGTLYQLDPTQKEGSVTTVSSSLGVFPFAIAFDGRRIWTANGGGSGAGSVSIVTLNPFSVTTITTGFIHPYGIVYDGLNIWITDVGDNSLNKLDSSGNILAKITVGELPGHPAFDGTNIWVPISNTDRISVVRATGGLAGTVLATLTGNGLKGCLQAAFDGERILVTNNEGDSVSLWKASDLTPIGTFSTGSGTHPFGVCGDGLNFWITLHDTFKLARF